MAVTAVALVTMKELRFLEQILSELEDQEARTLLPKVEKAIEELESFESH